MAEDGTAQSVGLQVEYRPSTRIQASAVGVVVDYGIASNAVGITETAGLQVEYSEVSPFNGGVTETAGLQVEYSETVLQGSVWSVGLQVEYKTFGIRSLDVDTISERGGTAVVASGTFKAGNVYIVTVADRPWYGGLGKGYEIECVTNGQLALISPPLPVGELQSITLYDVTDDVEATTIELLNVVPATETSTVFQLRSYVGAPRKVGPRSLGDVDI